MTTEKYDCRLQICFIKQISKYYNIQLASYIILSGSDNTITIMVNSFCVVGKKEEMVLVWMVARKLGKREVVDV